MGPARDHVTVISVPSPSSSVFNFEAVGAALESSGTMAPSQLYGAVCPSPTDPSLTDSTDTLDSTSVDASYSVVMDPNAVQLRIGNSLGAGGASTSGGGGGRPPLPPGQRTSAYSSGGMSGGYGQIAAAGGAGAGTSGGWTNNTDDNCYEPLFLASSAGLAPPSTPTAPPVPQAPQTGLLRRRSEHRRSGRREHGRRAASVGPSIAPKQQQQVSSLTFIMFTQT